MQRRTGFALTLGLALMTGLQSSARPAPPEGFIGSYHWRNADPAFGGLSAIEVLDEGRIVVLGDKGTLIEAAITRDKNGRISRAGVDRIYALRGLDGGIWSVRNSDSEGMDVARDGSLVISFEGKPSRVVRYEDWQGAAQDLATSKAFAKFPRNAGFEAVARDAEGTVFAIPEWSKSENAPFQVFWLLNGKWDGAFTLPRRGHFLPVSADFGPDGRLYLLERNFLGLMGFASRLRRFEVSENGLTAEEILFESAAGVHDNLEGLSIWRDSQGDLRATMVSDNNFQWVLRTELVEYRLPD